MLPTGDITKIAVPKPEVPEPEAVPCSDKRPHRSQKTVKRGPVYPDRAPGSKPAEPMNTKERQEV